MPLLVGGMLAVAVLALVLATRAPLATTVLGLIAFGALHNVLEIRYVAGRFAPVLSGRFLGLLLILITGIVLCRLASAYWPAGGRSAEIVLGFVVLAAGGAFGIRTLPGARSLRGGLIVAGVVVLLAIGATVSLAFPAYYFVVLTHLHNLVPLVFLWEWARRIPDRGPGRPSGSPRCSGSSLLPLVILARRRSTGSWRTARASSSASSAPAPR